MRCWAGLMLLRTTRDEPYPVLLLVVPVLAPALVPVLVLPVRVCCGTGLRRIGACTLGAQAAGSLVVGDEADWDESVGDEEDGCIALQ